MKNNCNYNIFSDTSSSGKKYQWSNSDIFNSGISDYDGIFQNFGVLRIKHNPVGQF